MNRSGDLFAEEPREAPDPPGLAVLRGLALESEPVLLADLAVVIAAAPWRHMLTPGGQRMSAAMTNCGEAGWVSDRRGYRYAPLEPLSGRAWPALPASLRELARRAADLAGFPGFDPDVCLVNRLFTR